MVTPKALYPDMAWFTGVVADRDDPLELGRLRVRINGYHNTSTTIIPDDDLPWCHVVQPITSQALDGVGRSPTGAQVGTHVIGFFGDGAENAQEPIIWGSIGGINAGTGESDTPRLARSKGILDVDTFEEVKGKEINKLDTILVDKLKTAIDDKPNNFKEPIPTYAGVYPTNHVFQSESGHVIEIDDTKDAERLHTYHKTGTYEEITPDGTKIVKVVGKDWDIIVKDKEVYVAGNIKTTVLGNEDVTIRGTSDVIIDKDSDIEMNSSSTVFVAKDSDVVVEGNCNLIVNGNFTLTVDGSGTITCGGILTLNGSIVNIN